MSRYVMPAFTIAVPDEVFDDLRSRLTHQVHASSVKTAREPSTLAALRQD
jgi:hypothetical protein